MLHKSPTLEKGEYQGSTKNSPHRPYKKKYGVYNQKISKIRIEPLRRKGWAHVSMYTTETTPLENVDYEG